MPDIVFVAVVIAFFSGAAGFVVLCDRIIGPADQAEAPVRPPTTVEARVAEAALR